TVATAFGSRETSRTDIVTRTRSVTDLADFTLPAPTPCTMTLEPGYRPMVEGKSAVTSRLLGSRGLAMTGTPHSPRLAMPKAATMAATTRRVTFELRSPRVVVVSPLME